MRTVLFVSLAGAALLGAALLEAKGAREGDRWFDAAARDGAVRTAALFANLSAHLRASRGDRRFAERLPADEPVTAEILADVAFVLHEGREERPQLARFEVVEVHPVAVELAEVRAREYWITRSRGVGGERTRSDALEIRYAMRREGGGWRVADWTPVLDGERAAATGAR